MSSACQRYHDQRRGLCFICRMDSARRSMLSGALVASALAVARLAAAGSGQAQGPRVARQDRRASVRRILVEKVSRVPVSLGTADILTSDGGGLGLGHAAIVASTVGQEPLVLEVLDTDIIPGPMATEVCIGKHRSGVQFVDDYSAENRRSFLSRVRKPAGWSDEKWFAALTSAASFVRDLARRGVCFSPLEFVLNLLVPLPGVWFCSQVVAAAYRQSGIELATAAPLTRQQDEAMRALLQRAREQLKSANLPRYEALPEVVRDATTPMGTREDPFLLFAAMTTLATKSSLSVESAGPCSSVPERAARYLGRVTPCRLRSHAYTVEIDVAEAP